MRHPSIKFTVTELSNGHKLDIRVSFTESLQLRLKNELLGGYNINPSHSIFTIEDFQWNGNSWNCKACFLSQNCCDRSPILTTQLSNELYQEILYTLYNSGSGRINQIYRIY